jgi:tetratricopeptide (TPR) repeat protein
MKRLIAISIIITVSLVGSACKKQPAEVALDQMSTLQLVESAMNSAIEAQSKRVLGNKNECKRWAESGMAYAERCIEVAPNTPDCYYWRAVNTGLYHSVKVVGYQRGIKQMIDDCNAVIAMGRENYDYGGPWRIQGQIFTKLPETGGRPDSLTRDLDKALVYLRKAVELAPDYPENRIALAEALYKEGETDAARAELDIAKQKTPEWRNDASYPEWKNTIARLMNKIDGNK